MPAMTQRTNDHMDEASDLAWQAAMLHEVSRTFALVIPELPPKLRDVISNAYLLCRIADTLEDDPELSLEAKRDNLAWLLRIMSGSDESEQFSDYVGPRLSVKAPAAERALVVDTPRVMRINSRFTASQRDIVARCVGIMSRGMSEFRQHQDPGGLKDLRALDRYCYFVAGVVGEMITELFCAYSSEIEPQRRAMMELAVSFGQGLQMTNILQDIWEDRKRGECWLPRDMFEEAGCDLLAAEPEDQFSPAFKKVMDDLVAIAHMHLGRALAYILLLPRHETGLRHFCLWPVGMAVMTLRRVHSRKGFSSRRQVRISRRSVKAVIIVTSLLARRDFALRMLFRWFTRSLRPSVALPQS